MLKTPCLLALCFLSWCFITWSFHGHALCSWYFHGHASCLLTFGWERSVILESSESPSPRILWFYDGENNPLTILKNLLCQLAMDVCDWLVKLPSGSMYLIAGQTLLSWMLIPSTNDYGRLGSTTFCETGCVFVVFEHCQQSQTLRILGTTSRPW